MNGAAALLTAQGNGESQRKLWAEVFGAGRFSDAATGQEFGRGDDRGAGAAMGRAAQFDSQIEVIDRAGRRLFLNLRLVLCLHLRGAGGGAVAQQRDRQHHKPGSEPADPGDCQEASFANRVNGGGGHAAFRGLKGRVSQAEKPWRAFLLLDSI